MSVNLATLDLMDQVAAAQDDINRNCLDAWLHVTDRAKLISIYCAIKNNQNLDIFIPSQRNVSNLVQAAIILIDGRNDVDRNALFLRFHNALQDYVVEEAWKSTEPLDLDSVLPWCHGGANVRYCEGRVWRYDPRDNLVSVAYCPRKSSECIPDHLAGTNEYENARTKGATFYPDCRRNPDDWSYLELMQAMNLNPPAKEFKKQEEYITKLAGWVNRLNEIRERIQCSVCGTVMIANSQYAKRLARYNATVFTCAKGSDHDKDVYISHCWGCCSVIDSRDNKRRVGKYYLCHQCGSGPENDPTYMQGGVCPKCGKHNSMIVSKYYNMDGRKRYCMNCKHQIKVPKENIRKVNHRNL